MSPRAKTFALLASLPILLLAAVLLGAAVAFGAGLVRIYVDEKQPDGERVHLVAPAALIPLVLHLVPDEKLRRAATEMQPWLPALRVASEELIDCPDGALVEVKSSREQVRILKVGGSLVIDVDSEDETVHVSFPLRVVASIAQRFEAIEPAS